MLVYPGRKALHVFDLVNEKWIVNSRIIGHQYEDIYYRVREPEDAGSDISMPDAEHEADSANTSEEEQAVSPSVVAVAANDQMSQEDLEHALGAYEDWEQEANQGIDPEELIQLYDQYLPILQQFQHVMQEHEIDNG